MNRPLNQFYEFGRFRLDPAEHLLLRDGKPLPLRPKVFDILLLLVENRGHLIEKDELMEKIWPGQFVEEGNLNKNISMLRQALGENPTSHQYIETVPKRGYRFVASVNTVQNGSGDSAVEVDAQKRPLSAEKEESSDVGVRDSAVTVDELRVSDSENLLHLPSTNGNQLATSVRRFNRSQKFAAAATLVIGVLAVSFGLWKFGSQKKPDQSQNLRAVSLPVKFTRLTYTGKAGAAAISPDGKYVAYVSSETGRQSIWLRQVTTDSAQQITTPDRGFYHTLVFSHDGNHIYYTRSDEGDSPHVLYRIPALGGVPARLIEDVFEEVSLSPNDSQLAFVRVFRSQGDSALMLANADGSGERRIATRNAPDLYRSPAWSPDGQVLACLTGNGDRGGLKSNVVAVLAADGSERMITTQDWPWIKNIAWLQDGSGLIINGTDNSARAPQIWLLSYPEGKARGITNDLNKYAGISLTRDSKTLAATLSGSAWNMWVAPNTGASLSRSDGRRFAVDRSQARKLATASGGVAWTPDNRLVYSSFASGDQEVWIANADGSEQRQLTSGAGLKRTPIVSPDGRYIVFASDAGGPLHLWRMELDDSRSMQLTEGEGGENYPCFSPDGRWVVYTQVKDWTLWKVPFDGGAPVRLADAFSKGPSVSPDGKLLAYYYREKEPNAQWKIKVSSFSDASSFKVFDVPRSDFQSLNIVWTPDGRALTYEAVNEGVSNIWRQPLDGGSPVQLTDFNSDYISYFAWSADGKRLACIRGGWAQDIVLITDFR